MQDQIEGTENRITVARSNYNASVQTYNTKVTNFPTSLVAGMIGFKERPMFEADKNAQSAPKVSFLNTKCKQESMQQYIHKK